MPALERVIMSDSIVELKSAAFSDCDALKYIEFSPNIQKVERPSGPFYSCDGLESVIFPDNAYDYPSLADSSYNGDGMFNYCSNLKYVKYPDNWSTIVSMAFCPALEEIVLPASIKYFQACKFYECNIKEFTVPSSVKSLPSRFIEKCSVGKLTIPQTVTSLGQKTGGNGSVYYWFYDPKNFGTQFYVVENSVVHNWLKERSYYHYTLISPSLDDIVVPRDKLCFVIIDQSGNPIEGAKVTCAGNEAQSNGSGIAYLEKPESGIPEITVQKTSYAVWSNQGACWNMNQSGIAQVTLFPAGTSGLKLAKALYEPSVINEYDLLRNKKLITKGAMENMIAQPGSGNFRIRCMAVNPSEVDHFELHQEDTIIGISTSGLFELSDEQFEVDKKCIVRVCGWNGDAIDTDINLEIRSAKAVKSSGITIKNSKLTIPIADDDIPLIGGSNISFDLSKFNFPLYFVSTESGVSVGVNLKLPEEDPEKTIKKARDFIRAAKRSGMMQLGRMSESQQKKFDSLKEKSDKAEFFGKCELSAIGYGEYDWETNTSSIDLMLQIKTGAEYSQTIWVVVVPVCVSAKLDLSLSGQWALAYDFNEGSFDGLLKVTPSAKFTGFGGIGIGNMVGAGAYGSLQLSGTLEIIPNFVVDTIDLTGELGVKAYVGPLEHSRAFAYQTWNIFTKGVVSAQSALEQSLQGQFDSTKYKLSDLSYLQEESAWLGRSEADEVDSMSDIGRTVFHPLLTETYRNMQPTMISNGNMIYAAFLKADSETGNVGTVVSCFNGIEWIEPVTVDDNALLDGAPKLGMDSEGRIWLAYTRTNDNKGTTMLEYAENQSIVVGLIDPETLAFQEQAEYTASGYAHSQTLTFVNGKPVLVWINSQVVSDNDVLWSTENTIYTASLTDEDAWEKEGRALSQVSAPILDIAAGEKQGKLVVGYFRDMDGLSGTRDDISLYQADGEEDTLLAENCSGKLQIVLLEEAEDTLFLWNGENELHFSDGTTVSATGVTTEYVTLNDRIYFSADTEGKADLFLMRYGDGEWENPVQITEGDRYFESFSVARIGDQFYTLGVYTSPVILENEVIDHKDLVWAQIRAQSDLILSEAYCETVNLVPGEVIDITLFVKNGSDHKVNAIRIEESGETIPCSIRQGEKAEITVRIPCPETLTEYTFTVSETGETDATPENNVQRLKIGYADLEMNAVLVNDNGNLSIMTVVTNYGIQKTSGTIIFTGKDGTEYAHADLQPLKHGESGFATLKLDQKIMPGFDLDVLATVAGSEEELSEENNQVRIVESIDYFNGYCGDQVQWRFTRDGSLIINGKGEMKTSGAWPWDRFRTQINRINVEEGITKISGYGAFHSCQITEATLPDSITDCGVGTFSDCEGLTTFTMPLLAESVPDSMFSRCENLEQVILSPNITSIGGMAFESCSRLNAIVGSEQIVMIDFGAFMRCSGLEEFKFSPEGVTIMEMAFAESGLIEIDIAGGNVQYDAFGYCEFLEEVRLGDQVAEINGGAFGNCASLKKVIALGDEVQFMEDAFRNSEMVVIYCRNTGTAYALAKKNEIPYVLINEKMNAEFVTPSSLKTIEEEAFSTGGFTAVRLNDGLEAIRSKAFSNCGSMVQIDIPDSVTMIAEDAFSDCNPLLIIFCNEESAAKQFAQERGIDYIINEQVEE